MFPQNTCLDNIHVLISSVIVSSIILWTTKPTQVTHNACEVNTPMPQTQILEQTWRKSILRSSGACQPGYRNLLRSSGMSCSTGVLDGSPPFHQQKTLWKSICQPSSLKPAAVALWHVSVQEEHTALCSSSLAHLPLLCPAACLLEPEPACCLLASHHCQ